MMKMIKMLAAGTMFSMLGALTALGQASVPNTFQANTPASAAEVNANFQALVDAANTNTPVPISGYGTPFPTSAAINNMNIIVYRWWDYNINAVTAYDAWVYKTGSNCTTTINSVTTPTAYCVFYISVDVDAGTGNYVGYNYNMESMDDPAYLLFNMASWSYDLTNSVWVLLDDSRYQQRLIVDSRTKESRIRHRIRLYRRHTDNAILGILEDSRIMSKLSTSMTINGMTFSDMMMQSRLRNGFYLIHAQGVGVVMWGGSGSTNPPGEVIYYNVEGVTEGSLSGTPFSDASTPVYNFCLQC